MPEYILRMKYTQTLLLNDNSLETLHLSLTRLSSLTLVNLDNNKLAEIPACIFLLTALESLGVADNRLVEVVYLSIDLSIHPSFSLSINPSSARVARWVGCVDVC